MSGPLTHEPLSILQWMAPDMARAGLLTNEEWIPAHAERACKLFPNQGVRVAATLLAVVDKRGIDYLEQAPVLALAAAHGSTAQRRADRAYIAYQFGPLAHRGVKLRDMLATYGMPMVMRKIAPFAVRPGTWKAIKRLAKLNPSTLSQIIPERSGAQARWLERLGRWSTHLGRRQRDRADLFEWAARALSAVDETGTLGIGDVADFMSEPSRFNPRFTWDQAADRMALWHDEIKIDDYLKRGGAASLDQVFDYAPYPTEAEAGEFRFIALRTPGDMIAEGRRMHHCVASYLVDVVKGMCRLYSVQRDGKRVATIEIVGGVCVQAKGPCNRGVAPAIKQAIEAFLDQAEPGRMLPTRAAA